MSVELEKYRQCLFDIKKRTEVIVDYMTKKKTTGYLGTDVELIALQFRKIIELIALLSLVANKKEYAAVRERFKEDWNAKNIFRDLERVNPKFYPVPSNQIKKTNPNGQNYFEFEIITDGFLTKKEAVKVYEKCSVMLHAENPFKGSRDLTQLQNQFPTWTKKVIKLLNHHSIVLVDNDTMVTGLMQSEDDGLPYAFVFGKLSNQKRKGS